MSEDKLFELVKKKIPDLYKIPYIFNGYDCTSKKYNAYIELKCRETHYQYLILEKKKYDVLIKHKNARYICSTPEGIWSFDVHKIKPEWYSVPLPKTTYWQGQIVIKEVCYLNVEEGKDISYILKFSGNTIDFSKKI